VQSSRKTWWFTALLVVCVTGCNRQDSPPQPVAAPPEVGAATSEQSTPFDVRKVMEQVHFAFRSRGSGWEGGHGTYAVRVEADGFSVRPYHSPEGTGREVAGEAVRFGAARVARGEQALSSLTAQGRVEETGALTLARGAVAEHFRNGPQGVEQSWSFEQRPEGTGALEVRLPVEHGRFVGETTAGLHFAAGPTGLGVRYGHGLWVDARGHRSAVPARFEAGGIVLRVPAEVLDGSAYPAVLDPTVSPELGLDNPVSTVAFYDQASPAVAHNGTNFLVVWQDFRNGGASSDIYGARVSGAGAVLDASGFAISNATGEQTSPSVAHDGTNFLVVWQDGRNGTNDIYGARVSGTGTVLDASGIPISMGGGAKASPSVTHAGTNSLVVWQDSRNGTTSDIYGARVNGAGAVLDASGIAISTAPNRQAAPAVADNGTDFLVVWEDARNGTTSDIYGARVNASGAVLDASGIALSTGTNNQTAPAVANNGTDFLVVWQDTRNGASNADIFGTRVSAAGAVLNAGGIAISNASGNQAFPSVANNGTSFMVAWHDLRSGNPYSIYKIYGARVSATGSVSDTNGISITPNTNGMNAQSLPALAFDGTSFLVVWQDNRFGSTFEKAAGNFDIYGARVNTTGGVTDPNGILISTAANRQASPSVAYNGTNFLVVWEDYRAGSGSDIYGARVNASGGVLDTSGIAISDEPGNQLSPVVSNNGTSFLVAWQDFRGGLFSDIYGARVSSTGGVLDTSGFAISNAANHQAAPALDFDGTNFLVVWQDFRNGGVADIYGARVSTAGAVVDNAATGRVLSNAANAQYAPAVAHDGTNFLVVWQDLRNGGADVYGARMSSAGNLLDATGLPISTAAGNQGSPSVAHDGTRFLVVWQDSRGGNADIYGTRLGADGSVLDSGGLAISTDANHQSSPSVAHDGTNFVVAWEDLRGDDSDIYGARVSGAGALLDPSGFAISADPVEEAQPALVSMGGRKSLVVYRRFHASANTHSERVLARFVSNTVPVATAQSASTNEDTSLALTLAGTDTDGDPLTYTLVQTPTRGTLTGTPPNLTYTPSANYHGPDTFTFRVNDGLVDSTVATVSLTVQPINDAPTAVAQSVSTDEDTALPITLTGTDVDGDTLTYTVVQAPARGTLTGTAPNLTYTPSANSNGSDTFTFRVNDGQADSAVVSVNLTVRPVNDAPVATAQSASTNEDTSVALTLAGTDVDGNPLTYSVVQAPTRGTLSGTAPNLTYTPSANYHGPDTFTFRVNDGLANSAVATVSLTVQPINDAPIAVAQNVATDEDTALPITLTGTDVDGDSLSYTVVQAPTRGTLSGTAPNLTYTPSADSNGSDTFTFRVNDGQVNSAVVSVNLTVRPVNDAPVATAQSVSTNEDTGVSITLAGTDVDGNPLTYSVVQAPSRGTLSGTPPSLTYTPSANYNGPDSFTFRANDGSTSSPVATVSLTVQPVNDAPLAVAQNVATDEDTALPITLTGTDVDGDSLSYTVVQAPSRGTLSGTAPNLTYTPSANSNGSDTFTFRVNDGQVDSAVVSVNLTVRPVNDAPVATAQSASTNEDTGVSITLAGTDVDGNPLTYSVVQAPTRGTISGTPPTITYTPSADYHGPDTFTFRANDGLANSAEATVSLTVRPINDAPLAVAQNVSTNEDTAVSITLSGTDVDGDTLTYTVARQPARGTLSGTAPNLTYTPNADYHGPDSFAFRVTDSAGATSTAAASVNLTVRPVNDAPVAIAQSASTDEDTAVVITLAGTDLDGDALTYTVVRAPANGTLTGTAPNFTYRPAAHSHGLDNFTFQVRDPSGANSNVATVSLTVRSVNDTPVAVAQSVSTDEDTAVSVTLVGTDVDGDTLTYTVVQAPSNGTLTGTAPNLTYTPKGNYNGADLFTFQVTDSVGAISGVATVSLTVRPVNDAPVAMAQSVSTDEDTAAGVSLVATDLDGDSLTYTVVQAPSNGTLGGTAPNFTYTPRAHYHGPDSFTFQVRDPSGADSNVATVSLTVRSVNDAPVAVAQSVSTDEDTAVNITLAGTDVEGDSLTYTLVQAPSRGTLSGTAPNLIYTPAANANGSDLFTFQVNDGQASSPVATVSLTVRSVNDAPVAVAQSVSTDEDTAVSITLTGTDVDGDTLSYTLVQAPSNGTLTGTAPNFVYTPKAHYNGPDSLTFQVNDGQVDSTVATVSLTVRSVNDVPVAVAQSVSTDEDTPVALTLEATDVDGSSFTYTVVQAPSNGTLSGTAPNLTYTPKPHFNGSELFTFQVRDASGASSNVATVSLTVRSVNDAPVAVAQTVATNEDTTLAITLAGTDVDGDTVTYKVLQATSSGTLTGTAPNLTYTPNAHYHGPDSLTFQVTDTSGTLSNVATVNVTVRSVNDAPLAVTQNVNLDEDTPVSITLSGTDVDGDTLTYTVVRAPARGTLSGTSPNLTYTPNADYHGPDSFAFRVTDSAGATSSAAASVNITVRSINDLPVAIAQSASTDEDTAVAITLAGTDKDGTITGYTVVRAPSHGTLTGTAPNLTYRPAAHYHGLDSFTFLVRDSNGGNSEAATVSLTVRSINDAPLAAAQNVSTDEDTAVELTLAGTDVDGDTLSYTVVQAPTRGTLSGTAPQLLYTPNADYNGPDSITFRVNDGQADSSVVTVSLTVRSINDAPVAAEQSASTDEDLAVALTLVGTDKDGTQLTYTVVQAPSNGTLTGTAPNLSYRPNAHYHGLDSFTFQVKDSAGDNSNVATVSLTVRSVNDAPVAMAQSESTDEDTAVELTLAGTDVDGDTLSYSVVQEPSHGTLTGTAPNLTYTPAANYLGPDSFTFRVNDGQADSAVATVSLTVRSVNDAPVAVAQNVPTDEDTAVALTLTGTDVDGDSLTHTVVQEPSHGTLTGTAPNLTYTPAAHYHGPDSFTFRVNDGQADSAVATVSLTVRSVNDAPVAAAQSASTDEDMPVALTLTGSDVDGDTLTYTVVQAPSHGTLNGTAPHLSYRPNAHSHGPDSFTFRVNDGQADSAEVTVSLTVRSVNDAPVATAQTALTDEDTAVALTLAGTDVDGDSLTLALVQGPSHGSLTGTVPDLIYTPADDYHGPDSFTFRVNDGQADSAVATVSLTVRSINDAPVALAQGISTKENTAVAITLSASDVDGDSLTYTVVQGPSHGGLSGTAPNLTYTPALNYNGPDSFTYQVKDPSGASSNVATVSLTVRSVNNAPVAVAQSVPTDEDTAVAITLTGTDADDDSLTYTVVQGPSHGTLSGTAPNLSYRPNTHANGPDSFTFSVSDGIATSAPATVSLSVAAVNDAPEALAQTLTAGQQATRITLVATDVEGDALTYRLESSPSSGTLTGTPPELSYTAPANFQGSVSFSFTASDGQATSAPATITLNVSNEVPLVAISASTLKPLEGEGVLFTSTAEDSGGNTLTYSWTFGDGATSQERHPAHTYVNEGIYEVVLTVSDGVGTGRATATLEVLNAAPVLVPLDVPATAEEAKPLTFQASASDRGTADTLSYSWNFGDGSPVVTGAKVTHAYADDGDYTVTVTVKDDAQASTQASRPVKVSNLPPVPEPVEPQSTQAGQELRVQLRATDVAGARDPLSWSLAEGPGAVSPTGQYSWTPPTDAAGEFVVRAKVVDDEGGANELVFRVTVNGGGASVPPGGCGCAGTGEATSFAALLLVALSARSRRFRGATSRVAHPYGLALLLAVSVLSGCKKSDSKQEAAKKAAAAALAEPGCPSLQLVRDAEVDGFRSSRYVWRDSACRPRSAALVNNDVQDPTGLWGGYMRRYTYEVEGTTRICDGASEQHPGWGYTVNHYDGTSLSSRIAPGTFRAALTGRHHALHEYRWDLNFGSNRVVKATVHWFFATGKDHPVWAVTFDSSGTAANALNADSRAPYGDLLYDGNANADIAGVAWGDKYRFESLTTPFSLNSAWTYNVPNVVPYVLSWTANPDAEMGSVQTQTWTQHDAGYGTLFNSWNTTSGGPMPQDWNWTYQINQYEQPYTPRSHRLAWGLNYGAVGYTSYQGYGNAQTRSGHPYQSYSIFMVLGRHSTRSVISQAEQVEALQAAKLTASVGTVLTQGPAGVGRTDTQIYSPAGYNPLYATWEVQAAGNQAQLAFTSGTRPVESPVFVLRGYTASTPPASVRLDGVTLRPDLDYYASVDDAGNTLWLTLARSVSGTVNLVVQ
jgi:hypothetical protein